MVLSYVSRSAAYGVTVFSACVVSIWAAPSLQGLFGGLLAVTMFAIAVIDARRFLIPDKLIAIGIALGLLHVAIENFAFIAADLLLAALRGLALALAFLALRETYKWWRGREGIGLGDVKLAFVAGVWLNWTAMMFAIQVAALAALVVIGFRAARGHRISATTVVPFGLFLAPAIWLGWMFEVIMQ